MPKVMSATPSTTRFHCCTGPAPSWPAGNSFIVSVPPERSAISLPNQPNRFLLMWCCGGMKVATESSSAAEGAPASSGATTRNAPAMRRRWGLVDG